MKNIKQILKEFDEKFWVEENDDWGSVPNPSEVKSFLRSKFNEYLEKVKECVPEKMNNPDGDLDSYQGGWNRCRHEVLDRINKL